MRSHPYLHPGSLLDRSGEYDNRDTPSGPGRGRGAVVSVGVGHATPLGCPSRLLEVDFRRADKIRGVELLAGASTGRASPSRSATRRAGAPKSPLLTVPNDLWLIECVATNHMVRGKSDSAAGASVAVPAACDTPRSSGSDRRGPTTAFSCSTPRSRPRGRAERVADSEPLWATITSEWTGGAMASSSSTRLTVYAARIGTLLVAATKTAAATLTGSSAMISKAIHSFVDTGNELLRLHGMRRSMQH